LFPDGSAEEVEYPDPDGSVEVCYTKDVLSKKLKEFAKGPLRAAIDYACRKNKLIDAAKETAHQAADQAVSNSSALGFELRATCLGFLVQDSGLWALSCVQQVAHRHGVLRHCRIC
jgi:hypothetical protein